MNEFIESRFNLHVDHKGTRHFFNTFSGALIALSPEECDELDRFLTNNEGDPDRRYPTFITDFVKGGFLVTSDCDELEALRAIYHHSRHRKQGLTLTIISSLGCNFSCDYCYEEKHPSILAPGLHDPICDFVERNLPSGEPLEISWLGGEPLLGRQSLFDLSRRFKAICLQKGSPYSASITTNGYLMNSQVAEELREHGVESAQVTLDGPPMIHDSRRHLRGGQPTFQVILRNIVTALEYFPISIRMNVDKSNINEAPELLDILRAEGLGGRVAVYLAQTTRPDGVGCLSKANFSEMAEKFDSIAQRYSLALPGGLPERTAAPCTAVRRNEFVIGSEGEIYKCWESVGQRNQAIGHIRDFEAVNIDGNRWVTFDPFKNRECRECHVLPVCMGGCAQHAMDLLQYPNRCNAFRFSYAGRIRRYVDAWLNGGEANIEIDATELVQIGGCP